MTVNFDVKKLRIRPWDTLYEKSPFVRNIRHRFAQLRYIAKGVTRLFVKIFNLFLETQVRLLIFCMLRIKAKIQIEPLAINELHLESSKYRFFLSRALNIPLEKVSQIRKKRVYFQLKDMITFNFYDQKTKQSVASVFYKRYCNSFITERSPLTLSYSTCSLYNDFFQLKQLRSLLA